MPPRLEAIIRVLAPFAPFFSHRVWLHAQVLLLGAMLAPEARTVTAALRAMGLAAERRFTNDHRVLNRARWSTRQAGRILVGGLITVLVPAGATIVLEQDDRPRYGAAADGNGAFNFRSVRGGRYELTVSYVGFESDKRRIDVRPDLQGLMVSEGNLLIGDSLGLAPRRVQALLHHEVGTHLLTYFNGREQPFQQMYAGLAGYEARSTRQWKGLPFAAHAEQLAGATVDHHLRSSGG